MPSLLVYNRRSIFAGDDLQPSAVLTMTVRVVQVVFMVLPLAIEQVHYLEVFGLDIYSESNGVGELAVLMSAFIVLTLLYSFTSFVLECRLYKYSGIGTPIQPEQRQAKVGRLMEYKVLPMAIAANLIFLLGIATLGFASAAHIRTSRKLHNNSINDWSVTTRGLRYIKESEIRSDSSAGDFFINSRFKIINWLALTLLVVTQMAEAIISLVGLIRLTRSEKAGGSRDYLHKLRLQTTNSNDGRIMLGNEDDFDSSTRSVVSQAYQYTQYRHEVVEEMWDQRCQRICKCAAKSSCYLFGGRSFMNNNSAEQQDFRDIATALADYFENIGLIDVVASDIVAGVIMLQKVQRQRLINLKRTVLKEKEETFIAASAVKNQNMCERLTQNNSDLVEYGSSSFENSINSVTGISSQPYHQYEIDFARSNFSALVMSTDKSAYMMRMKSNSQSSVQYETRRHKVMKAAIKFDRAVIAEGARFSRYALAIYTWVLYFYMYPISGPWRLFFQRLKALNCRKKGNSRSVDRQFQNIILGHVDDDIVGDNFLRTHKDSLLAISGIRDTDLAYASFNNDSHEIPYCILVDHNWRSVVLSIRGTLSLEDLIIDGSLSTASLEDLGNEFEFDGTGERCHAGILACAKFLYEHLKSHDVLGKLLDGQHALFPKYTLRVVGHSVGAGIATVLTLMLRPKYPHVRCLAYSPPGQFLTWRLANETKDICNSFVLDSDFIPRLTVLSMEHLRNEILDMIGRLKVSKTVVMNSVVKSGFGCRKKQDIDEMEMIEEEINTMLHPKGETPKESDFFSQVVAFKSIVSERKQARGGISEISLYPPGRIIHLVKTGQRDGCSLKLARCMSCGMSNVGSEYTPVWAENDDFNEIMVSPTMWTDHFPNRVCKELEKIANSFGIDTTMATSLRSDSGSNISQSGII